MFPKACDYDRLDKRMINPRQYYICLCPLTDGHHRNSTLPIMCSCLSPLRPCPWACGGRLTARGAALVWASPPPSWPQSSPSCWSTMVFISKSAEEDLFVFLHWSIFHWCGQCYIHVCAACSQGFTDTHYNMKVGVNWQNAHYFMLDYTTAVC